MENLAATLRERIKTDQDLHVIKTPELRRLWPNLDDEEREEHVRAFADKEGFQLYAYYRGVGAFIIKR